MMRNLYILGLGSLLISTSLFASQVTKVKGSNALIDLQGESAAPGDTFFSLSADGKKRGILQITKVKGDKAIAKITKGKAEAGMTLQSRGGATASSGGKKHSGGKSGGKPGDRSYWGGMVGYAMDSMKVSVLDSHSNPVTDASLTGSAFSAMAMFDYELFPQIWFRGLAGLESFNVSGPAVCDIGNKSTCNASIYYMSADFVGRYVFSEGTIRPWLGGGLALMFPASKSATALDSGSISNTSVILVTGGVDWFISPTFYIPVSVEYGLLPKSNQVDASWIEMRIGAAVPF